MLVTLPARLRVVPCSVWARSDPGALLGARHILLGTGDTNRDIAHPAGDRGHEQEWLFALVAEGIGSHVWHLQSLVRWSAESGEGLNVERSRQ